MTLKIDVNSTITLERATTEVLENCYRLAEKGNLKQATEQCKIMVKNSKSFYEASPSISNMEFRNMMLVVGILFSGIKDFFKICEITHENNWNQNNEKIEKVWVLLHDCRERLEFSVGVFCAEFLDYIYSELEALDREYLNAFGSGVYFSPEIVCIEPRCSICRMDCRACEHVSGSIYDGKLCRYVPKDVKLIGNSIVFAPRDPRCRIWPWNTRKSDEPDYSYNVSGYVITTFNIIDFLDNEKSSPNHRTS